MSTNLCTDKCVTMDCDYQFNLPDFVGQPIEFRQYARYKPQMGTKLICPKCKTVYFGWIREDWTFWGKSIEGFDKNYVCYDFEYSKETHINHHKDKFAVRMEDGSLVELGYYQIDIAYYDTYRDEGEGIDVEKPAYLTTKDCEVTRWYND